MSKTSGFLVSEMVTAVIVVVILFGIGYGLIVSGERDDMVEQALASLETIREQVATASESGEPLACTDELVDASALANDFLPLTLKSIPRDSDDLSKGYGPGIYVRSKKNEDTDDKYVTARRLYEALKEQDEESLLTLLKKKDEIEYSVLVSQTAVCEREPRRYSGISG